MNDKHCADVVWCLSAGGQGDLAREMPAASPRAIACAIFEHDIGRSHFESAQ